MSKKLIQWGRLRLVSSPEDADLVLEVVQTGTLAGGGNQAAASLKDTQSGQEFWTSTRGGGWATSGWSNAWVGRAIAKDFIKFFDSATEQSRK